MRIKRGPVMRNRRQCNSGVESIIRMNILIFLLGLLMFLSSSFYPCSFSSESLGGIAMSANKQFYIAIRHVCTSGKLPLQAKASPKNSQLCCRAVPAARELFADIRQLVAHGVADVGRRVCRDRSCGRLQGFPELFAAWPQLKLLPQWNLHTTAGCCES